MKLRSLGKSGLMVSVIGLGTANFVRDLDAGTAQRVVGGALDAGVTLFDTADRYNFGGSEEMLGIALGSRRQDVIVSTKWGAQMRQVPLAQYRGRSRDTIMKAVEQSLRRLRTDYIDLYQLHKPDLETPVEEMLRAMDDLVHQGKVRYLGLSNIAAWQVVEAQLTAKARGLPPIVSCQDEYNLLNRDVVDRELMPMMRAHGVGLLPFLPLAGGLLTGKYRRNELAPAGSRYTTLIGAFSRYVHDHERYATDQNWETIEALTEFAAVRGHSILELALSWLLARPTVASIIMGASSPDQVVQNVGAASWVLTSDDMLEIDRITQPS